MDFSQQKGNSGGPCHVIAKSNEKIILKSVTVKESSNFGCFKQTIFSSLKPSFEKTLNFFGKDKSSTNFLCDDEESNGGGGDKKAFLSSATFGSTPAVNVLDKKIIEDKNCCLYYKDSDQRKRKQLSASAKELNKITPLGDKISCNGSRGKKYAIVKIDGSNNNISGSVDEVRLRGRTTDIRHLVEDGLGVHQNLSPLVHYEQFTPGYHHQELNHHQQQQQKQQKYLSQSQFYPNEMNDYNFRRFSTAATNPEQSSSAATPATHASAAMAVVRPESNSGRCYSTASNSSKKLSKRLSMSTVVPSSYNIDDSMRGHSIDKRDPYNYSDTPRTSQRPLYSGRHLSQSHIDFYNHAQFRQGLQPLSENLPANSAITGSNYSQPRKPTSVVELPSAPIQPQFYSSNPPFQKFSNENPTTPTSFDISHNFQPLKSSTPRQHQQQPYGGHDHEWVTPSQQFFGSTTTFGTEPQRKSTYASENNAFSPDESPARRQSSSAEALTDQAFEGTSTEENNSSNIHSPMSNSGHSSSAATTTTTDTIMPTFFNNGTSNKVAVAPQPQPRPNRHSTKSKEEIPRFRTQVSHSPYQMAPSNGVVASRSGHRLNRLSSEVFIDGRSPPLTPDGHTDVRVSLLEDKIRNIESELSGRTASNSRQNMTFNAPSEAQRIMMNEIIDKDILIGQLKSRVQGLAAQLERQQMEFDEDKRIHQKENNESRNKYQAVKKKLQQLTEQLDGCDKTKDEEITKIKKELVTVKEQIRLRDQEIAALKARLAASADGELVKLREIIREKDHINTELQDELVSKNAEIKQLKRLIDDLNERHGSTSLNSSKSCVKPESKTLQHRGGVETLTEIDTEEDEDAFRRDLTTPTPTSKSTFSLSAIASQGDEKVAASLSPVFNNLIRTHYRKTQICHELAKSISEATAKLLEGKRNEAGRLLGFITDTEGDDSEAINSETTLTNSKMSVTVAERFLRKECDMMNHVEKYLNDVRINQIEACQKGPKIFAKNSDCHVQ